MQHLSSPSGGACIGALAVDVMCVCVGVWCMIYVLRGGLYGTLYCVVCNSINHTHI